MMLNAIKSPVMSVLLLHQVDSPMVANCLLETWLIATSNMIWLPNEKSELHFKIFKHYLNKTSATKLSINFMFNLVTSWQHMATFQKFQSTTTQNLPGPACSRVCPTYSLGSQGCAAWLPATTAMKVEHA